VTISTFLPLYAHCSGLPAFKDGSPRERNAFDLESIQTQARGCRESPVSIHIQERLAGRVRISLVMIHPYPETTRTKARGVEARRSRCTRKVLYLILRGGYRR
jgi:hypothetical protein